MRYFRYLFEKGSSALTRILDFSRATVTFVPKSPALPLTLILSWRNFSKPARSMILSSRGAEQSIANFATVFFVLGFLTGFYKEIQLSRQEERMNITPLYDMLSDVNNDFSMHG